MHRFLRCMICFLLICSLLVNFLPTRAEAISTGVAVSAGIVASAIIYGLGVSIGDHPDEFNSLVSDFFNDMETAGVLVTNGLMDVMSLGSGLFGVKLDVIQSLFDWLWADKVVEPFGPGWVSSGSTAHFKASWSNQTWSCSVSDFFPAYLYLCKDGVWGTWCVMILSNTSCSVGNNLGTFRYYQYSVTGGKLDHAAYEGCYFLGEFSVNSPDGIGKVLSSLSLSDFEGEIQTDKDLTLNFVANPGVSLATGYPAWHANSVTIPNAETGEDETYYPIALGNSMEETQSFTQEQVWAGAGTYVDSESVPGTGDGTITVPDNVTLKDILAGVLSIPHAIATGIEKVVAAVVALPAAIVDGLRNPKPPDDHNNFALADLKNFFPFCIPFDLYAFFQLLNADPVAPVLSWEIQDLVGQTYSLSVDLAEWDSVAQLFRRLQLFLFITGLAAASRKFIKW